MISVAAASWNHPVAGYDGLRLSSPILLAADDCPRGRLFFGAARGPRSWNVERDGPWQPGYWVEVQSGSDDGAILLVEKDRLESGLTAGDLCGIDVRQNGEVYGLKLTEAAVQEEEKTTTPGFRYERNRIESRRAKLLRDVGRPLGIGVAVAAMAALFAQFTPEPSLSESLERCARLVSGSVEAGDRVGAERWMSTCGLAPEVDAEGFLAETWLRRWGENGPPNMIQGVPERSISEKLPSAATRGVEDSLRAR